MKSKHYLATALLNYLDSSDYYISCQALKNLINISGTLLFLLLVGTYKIPYFDAHFFIFLFLFSKFIKRLKTQLLLGLDCDVSAGALVEILVESISSRVSLLFQVEIYILLGF